jgi:hypothetical protein
VNTRTNRILACAGVLLAVAAFTPSAMANLLVDPGFEANPLYAYRTVLGDFPTYEGKWGAEVATITGAEGGVTPPEGVKMLRMVNDEQVQTQAFQVTDVTSYENDIDTGGATVNMSAWFTAPQAAYGAVVVQFFGGPDWDLPSTWIAQGLTLDSTPSTWERISVSGTIPVGTRWMVSQVYYTDASLGSNPGYVDAADLTIVPEPATLSLLVLGGLAVLRRRK